MPVMRGTGAFMYSRRVEGRMGISTCSQRKGKTKARKASTANPSTVLDCETKMTFFSRRMASKTLRMAERGRNLKVQ
jgi:hypothetical protein